MICDLCFWGEHEEQMMQVSYIQYVGYSPTDALRPTIVWLRKYDTRSTWSAERSFPGFISIPRFLLSGWMHGSPAYELHDFAAHLCSHTLSIHRIHRASSVFYLPIFLVSGPDTERSNGGQRGIIL